MLSAEWWHHLRTTPVMSAQWRHGAFSVFCICCGCRNSRGNTFKKTRTVQSQVPDLKPQFTESRCMTLLVDAHSKKSKRSCSIVIHQCLIHRFLQEEEEEIHHRDSDAAHSICAHPHFWPGSNNQNAEHHSGGLLPRTHRECTFRSVCNSAHSQWACFHCALPWSWN